MKILFISFAFIEYSIRLTSALAKDAEVCLMLPAAQAEPHLYRLNPEVAYVPISQPRLRQVWRQAATMRWLLAEIQHFDPDVIHLQQGYLWLNPILSRLKRYPLVITIHDPTPHSGDKSTKKTPQFVMDWGFKRADRLIVHNEQMRQIVVERGLPSDRVNIVPTVERGDSAGAQDVQEDEHSILFFGRIWPYKGLEYLIKAEPLITAQLPNVKIIIAGEGEEFDRYRRLMTHPEQFIVYNDYIPHEQVAELFRRTSIVVLPYIDATQSGVIPTAYTFSKPVVATPVGGIPSMVEHGKTGLLVPPRDERALAEAIIQLMQNRELRHQMGANGKKKVNTEYAAETVAPKTLAVYEQAIRSPFLQPTAS